MKHLLTLLFLFLGIGLFAQVLNDSTAVLNFGGDDLMQIFKDNVWTLVFVILLIVEKWLGNTGKVKANSVLDVILNFLMSMLKKKAGKATIIAVGLFCLGSGLSEIKAQSKFDGFFKPLSEVVQAKSYSTRDTIITSDKGTLIFRPAAVITTTIINPSAETVSSCTGAGLGLTYGEYKQIDGKAYCTWSLNALFLTQVAIGDTSTGKVGGAVTLDCFNKLIGAGVGFLDNEFVILTTISISF